MIEFILIGIGLLILVFACLDLEPKEEREEIEPEICDHDLELWSANNNEFFFICRKCGRIYNEND